MMNDLNQSGAGEAGAPQRSWRLALLHGPASVQDAIRNLDSSGMQIALVVDDAGELVGTLTDGDLRRGLLKGLGLTSSIEPIIQRDPLVVPPSLDPEMALQLMRANKIRQLPIVDGQRRVVGLHSWGELVGVSRQHISMVIMAGGMGTRLLPHTEHCPKPLLWVQGKPMLEHLLDRARAEGIVKFTIALRHLGHMIEEYFGDGRAWGVQIDYLREEHPLGTAGALGLITPAPTDAFIVANGDILTDVRFGELLEFHRKHRACATMAVRLHEWQHPYGVVHIDGIDITGFEEKPVARSHVNAGVYVLSPTSLSALTAVERCDMPTLFARLRTRGDRTIAFPMHEPWLDVGLPADYEKAGGSVPTTARSGKNENS